MEILVIGAGITGLRATQLLDMAGHAVTLVDKGRGPGGRCATRRADAFAFDHGAPGLQVTDDSFSAFLSEHALQASWPLGGEAHPVTISPRMSSLGRTLESLFSDRVSIQYQTPITSLAGATGAWRAVDDAGTQLGPFEHVVVTIPAPQAVTLLAHLPESVSGDICHQLLGVVYEAQLTLMLGGAVDDEKADIMHHADVQHVIANHLKPGRAPENPSWVLHLSAAATQNALETPLSELPARYALTQTKDWSYVRAHRWRYAQVSTGINHPKLKSPCNTLWVAGDYMQNERHGLNAAWRSGTSVALAINQS